MLNTKQLIKYKITNEENTEVTYSTPNIVLDLHSLGSVSYLTFFLSIGLNMPIDFM